MRVQRLTKPLNLASLTSENTPVCLKMGRLYILGMSKRWMTLADSRYYLYVYVKKDRNGIKLYSFWAIFFLHYIYMLLFITALTVYTLFAKNFLPVYILWLAFAFVLFMSLLISNVAKKQSVKKLYEEILNFHHESAG